MSGTEPVRLRSRSDEEDLVRGSKFFSVCDEDSGELLQGLRAVIVFIKTGSGCFDAI